MVSGETEGVREPATLSCSGRGLVKATDRKHSTSDRPRLVISYQTPQKLLFASSVKDAKSQNGEFYSAPIPHMRPKRRAEAMLKHQWSHHGTLKRNYFFIKTFPVRGENPLTSHHKKTAKTALTPDSEEQKDLFPDELLASVGQTSLQ